MKVTSTTQSVTEIQADAVVLGVYAEAPLEGEADRFDDASGKLLSRLRERGEFTGRTAETLVLHGPQGMQADQVVVVGLGKKAALDRGNIFRAAGAAAKLLAARPRRSVAFLLGGDWPDVMVEAGVCGAMVGCRGQDLYRDEKRLHPLGEIQWQNASPAALAAGQVLGSAVNLTRRLVNEPASEIYPESFADIASEMAAEDGLDIEVWDEDRLHKENCGALLGVARGSARPPRLVILRHQRGGDAPTLALVGKGVTFDSGGLSLKPTDSMKTMKCDMAGAATVVGALQAIARLDLPINVLGLCGLVENMVSGTSYKLGDILKTRSGKTIEVLNTDAEGRLVLADVLDVAVDRGAAKIIDLATLTGACMVALGTDVAGLMTNNQSWAELVAGAARICGEPVWQLPMFEEYGEQIKSEVADIKNVGEGRWAGAITAAKLLEAFVRDVPWVHLDIAGPAFLEKPKPWQDTGATGAFVRTLVEVARRWP
ncbi:MAG: putative cytosol aminopeptidase [Gemmatales bacterium]|nr:MAG: putative cytosol aminopeptidase [Gemmatales bacterium]